MKMNRTTARGFTLVELLVVITIIAALVGLTAPMVIKNMKKGPFVEALNNSKQIHLALIEFDKEYNSFPDKETLPLVKESTDSPLAQSGGNFSNDFFRQLLAAGQGNEKMFYAKAVNTKKPDDIIDPPAKCLEAGEVGFGYIMDGTSAFSSSNSAGIPILATPLLKGSTELFDAGPFGDKAVVLRIDGSAAEMRIAASKKLSAGGGKTFLQTGTGTIWGSEIKPRIVPPKPRGVTVTADDDAPAPSPAP